MDGHIPKGIELALIKLGGFMRKNEDTKWGGYGMRELLSE